jgi:hypothetical protein
VLAVAATMAVPVFGMASPAGAAEDAAKASCKNDGWKTLVRADHTSFKNQGDCVSYAARGGTFGVQCIDSAYVGGGRDITFEGPIDTHWNATRYDSYDGSCSPFLAKDVTIVSAPDQAAAEAKCLAINGFEFTNNFNSALYPVPSDWWYCLFG